MCVSAMRAANKQLAAAQQLVALPPGRLRPLWPDLGERIADAVALARSMKRSKVGENLEWQLQQILVLMKIAAAAMWPALSLRNSGCSCGMKRSRASNASKLKLVRGHSSADSDGRFSCQSAAAPRTSGGAAQFLAPPRPPLVLQRPDP